MGKLSVQMCMLVSFFGFIGCNNDNQENSSVNVKDVVLSKELDPVLDVGYGVACELEGQLIDKPTVQFLSRGLILEKLNGKSIDSKFNHLYLKTYNTENKPVKVMLNGPSKQVRIVGYEVLEMTGTPSKLSEHLSEDEYWGIVEKQPDFTLYHTFVVIKVIDK